MPKIKFFIYGYSRRLMADVKRGIPLSVPLHLRNAPTKLMKEEGYGEDYRYPHDFDGNFTEQRYFPEDVKPQVYYNPGNFGKEGKFRERLKNCWKDRNY